MNGSLLATPAAAAPVQTYTTPDFRPLWNWTISDVYDRGKFTPISGNVDSNWVGKWVNIRLDHSVLLDGTYEAVMSNDSLLSETKDILINYLPWIQAPGIYQLLPWIQAPGIYQLLPWRGREGPHYPYFVDRTEDVGPAYLADTTVCPPPGCSSFDDCMKVYDSLNRALEGIDPDTELSTRMKLFDSESIMSLEILVSLVANNSFPPYALSCPVLLANTSATETAFYKRTAQQCFPPIVSSWKYGNADNNLGVFRNGGVDDDGVFHPGIAGSGLSSALRKAFLGGVSSDCSMESICEPPAVCTQVGTRFTLDPQRPLFQSPWAYNVLTAIANINQELFNQYQALQSAAIESALATFNIADYWPKPSKDLQIKNIITGLSVALAAVSGFIPFLGPELIALQVAGATVGGLGAVAGGVGTFFERSLAKNPDLSDPT